jgi:hypothetical protein
MQESGHARDINAFVCTYLVWIVESSLQEWYHDVVLAGVVRMNVVPVSRPHTLEALHLPLIYRSTLTSSSGGNNE